MGKNDRGQASIEYLVGESLADVTPAVSHASPGKRLAAKTRRPCCATGAARIRLGELWELGRPLRLSELGRLLGLQGREPGATVRDWECGKNPISGPAALAIRALLEGWKPAEWRDYLTPADRKED